MRPSIFHVFQCFGLFPVICCTACGQPSVPAEGVDGLDTLYDIFAPKVGPLRLADAPSLVVGRDDSLPLDRVHGGVFFHRGVAIINGNEILVFDGDGRLVSRQGQTGEGPGDYKSLFGLARFGNGLVTWDIGLSRFTILDANARYLGDVKIHPGASFTLLVGAFGNDVLVHHLMLGLPGEGVEAPHESRLEDRFEIYNLEERKLVVEASRPGEERWAARTEVGAHGGLPVVFGRKAVAAVAHERAYIATTDSLIFTELDGTGKTKPISLPHPTVRTERGWAAMVRDSLREHTDARPDTYVQQRFAEFDRLLLEELPARATLPSFAAMQGGSDGLLWVQSYPSPDQAYVTWVALDESWQPQQWVSMPRELRVLDFGEGRVLLFGKGRFGEDLVEVYSLVQ